LKDATGAADYILSPEDVTLECVPRLFVSLLRNRTNGLGSIDTDPHTDCWVA